MQLITTRNKEISFAELKKAISSGNGLELIAAGDKFAIELKNGELVNAVCGGYVNEKRARFVLEDCLADKWRMNDTPTNKGGYLKSEGRRHVLEDILPLFPDATRRERCEDTPRTRAACNVAQGALYLQMKASPYHDGDENVLACQNCKSGEYLYNEDGNRNSFCGQCGKAIDWGEEVDT